MAGSNWDSFGFNDKREPATSFRSPAGVEVEIYKNYVYVNDRVAWRESGIYVEPTVMEIHEGALTYVDVQIIALRSDEQQACFVAAWSDKDAANFVGFIGVGVYGFDDRGEWIGVLDSTKRALFETLEREGVPPLLLILNALQKGIPP